MKKRRERIYKIAVVIFLLLVALISLTPFIYLLVTSLVGDMSLVFKNGIALKIRAEMLTINNYKMLFTDNGGIFFHWFKNSVIITLLFTVLSRHDDIDTARLPSDRGDDTLQILKVVVRGHVVDLTVQGIGQAVVADIHHQIDILSTDGFAEYAFCFS